MPGDQKVDWKAPDAFTHLLAAVVAASPDIKADYRQVATYCGRGATYDAVEGRFRNIRAEAKILRNEVESGVRKEAPKRGALSTPSLASGTPKKKRCTAVKKEDGNDAAEENAEAAATPKRRDETLGGKVTKNRSAKKLKVEGKGKLHRSKAGKKVLSTTRIKEI